MKDIPAIPTDSFEKVVKQWADIVKFRESGSVYYYNKSDLLWRFRNLFDDTQLYRKYFGNRVIHIIDAEAEPFDDPDELFDIIKNRSKKPKDDIFFLTGIDKILTHGNTSLLASIMKRDAHAQEGSFVLFFTIDFTHPKFRGIFESFTTSIQKILIHPLHSYEDTIQYIRHQSNAWNMNIPASNIERIAYECGGYFLFPKEAIRYIRDNPTTSIETAIHHKEMEMRV